MYDIRHIAHLLYKDLEGKLTSQDAVELQSWKEESADHQSFYHHLKNEEQLSELLREEHPDQLKLIEDNILKKIEEQISFNVVPLYRRKFFRVAVAACIAALFLAGGYFLYINKQDRTEPPIVQSIQDVPAPTGSRATITLADGHQVYVDSLTTLAQSGVTVTKTADGRLVYTGFGSEVTFNTLTNPNGSRAIDIQLADGSRVWLNAGSSITYPTAFNGNTRDVTMTGEAAFKVSHDGSKPFTVTKGETSVTVLGTEFNVNAYEDEPTIKVTLLEGSVKVINNQRSLTIKPNQQAIVNNHTIELNSNANVEEVMAWRNGLFVFHKASIESIMKEVSRYYGVEVVYEGKIQGGFVADLSRDNPVSTLLLTLEKTNRVHFEIEGKTITVRP